MSAMNASNNAPESASAVALVMSMALGYLVSRSLHVATELGIADLIGDAPKTVEELARHTGAHRDSLYRLLRTLAAHGIFAEHEPGRFSATAAGRLLRRGAMRDGVLLCGEVAGDGSWWRAVGDLRASVMSGKPAFERLHRVGFFDYLRQRPECAEWFDRGMANFAAAENPAIADAYDFGRFGHIIDVGGGQGGLLAEILKQHAMVHGTLFDLPEVVTNPAYLKLEALSGRWTTLGGDFFQTLPAGADAYVLKRILHDWDDAQCLRILRCCGAAMTQRARLLIVDAVVPKGNVFHPSKVMDILMMVFAGGRERTKQEFEALLRQAGLRLSGVTKTESTLSIVEAMLQ